MKSTTNYFLETEVNRTPDLYGVTQELIHSIQASLDGVFLTFWQSTDNILSEGDAVALRTFLMKQSERKPLFMFMRTLGGSVAAALRIIHMLHDLFHPVTMLIPLNASSAGTMIAISAHEIQMGVLGSLTPVDVSIKDELSPSGSDEEPASISEENLRHIMVILQEHYRGKDEAYLTELFQFIHPLVVGRIARVSEYAQKCGTEGFQRKYGKTDVDTEIIESLNRNFPSHNYPVTRFTSRQIGLPVKDMDPGLEEKLLKLNQLYSEMCQMQYTCLGANDYYMECATGILEKTGTMAFEHTSERRRYHKRRKTWMKLNAFEGWKIRTGLDTDGPKCWYL